MGSDRGHLLERGATVRARERRADVVLGEGFRFESGWWERKSEVAPKLFHIFTESYSFLLFFLFFKNR